MRWKSRFLVLRAVASHVDARRGYLLWSAWSELCHYQPYDLMPDAQILGVRIDDTARWIAGQYDMP